MSAPTTNRRAAPIHDFDCAECGKRIEKPATGFIAARYNDAMAAEFAEAHHEYEQRHAVDADGLPALPVVTPLRSLLMDAMPDNAPWQAHHYDCHSDTDPALYTIELERITQWWEVADWTAHLLGRGWLSYTDWDELLRHFAGLGARESQA